MTAQELDERVRQLKRDYDDDGSQFCGPDPTTWYYHECTLKPNTTGRNEYENCMHVNPNGECKDFERAATTFKPPWTYRDLAQYRRHMRARFPERESLKIPKRTFDYAPIESEMFDYEDLRNKDEKYTRPEQSRWIRMLDMDSVDWMITVMVLGIISVIISGISDLF